MAEWSVIYQDGYEDGFISQDGEAHLSVPIGHVVRWVGTRPECKPKDKIAGQPEVYAGRYAASIFTTYATHDAYLVSGPITVVPGMPTRGSAYGMIVCHGIDGDDSRPGAQAVRAGIAETDDVTQVQWGEWWAVRDSLTNERIWAKLETPEVTPGGPVYLFLQTKSDYPVAISAAHFDSEAVEQRTGDVPPLPVGGSLQEYIDEVQAALDGLQGYVNANVRQCIVV